MADDPKHPDNWDREKKIFMAIIEVNNPGFSLKGWAEVAARLGLSEATVKQCLGECKKNWLSANEGVTMPAPVIKTRKRGNKHSVANDEEIEDDGDDVPSAVPGRPSRATSSAPPANNRARQACRTTPKAGSEEIEETSQPQSEDQPEPEPNEEEVEDDGDEVPSTEPSQATQATSSAPPVNNRALRTRRTATQAGNEEIKEADQAQSEARLQPEPEPELPATTTIAGDKRKRPNDGNAAVNSQTRSPATGTKKGKKPTPLFEKWTRERRAEVRREREELARQAEEDQ
ncbi:hypothetical protein PG995_003171 [Apiospora arundinis]